MAEAKIRINAEDLASSVAQKVGEIYEKLGGQVGQVNAFIIQGNAAVQESYAQTASMSEQLASAIENPTGAARDFASTMRQSVIGSVGEPSDQRRRELAARSILANQSAFGVSTATLQIWPQERHRKTLNGRADVKTNSSVWGDRHTGHVGPGTASGKALSVPTV